MNAQHSGVWLYWIGGVTAALGLVAAVLSPLFAKLAIDGEIDSAPIMSPDELTSPARWLLVCIALAMGVFTVGLTILFVGYRRMQRDRNSSDGCTAEQWSG